MGVSAFFAILLAALRGWLSEIFRTRSWRQMDDGFQIFSTRIIWLELGVPERLLREKAKHYFGSDTGRIDTEQSINILKRVSGEIQEKMVRELAENDARTILAKLFKILDETYHFYLREKIARVQLSRFGVGDASIVDTFAKNRNISRSIIDATYIWIENSILHQVIDPAFKPAKDFSLDHDLMLDMYFYGLASQALSLLTLTAKNPTAGFDGLDLMIEDDIVAQVHKEHPVVYFNLLLSGNQHILDPEPNLIDVDSTPFGAGFRSVYEIDFRQFLGVIVYFQTYVLYDGKYALVTLSKAAFHAEVAKATTPPCNPESFTRYLALTQQSIKTQLRNNEPIIWVMGTNKIRLELLPFVMLNNGDVLISYCALDQAKQLWGSLSINGGMCYTNVKDDLTNAFDQKNNELSKRLVQLIRKKLQTHYSADFDETDVTYDRIFGKRPDDYGDYDLVFYTRQSNELFLIEAKYFSDSLTSSGLVTDFTKLFAKGRYYEHCRRRYDLVLAEPEKIKAFVASEQTIDVHFLFVTSKPLEVEIQDADGVVTFLSLSIFDNYLEGKLINSEDDSIVRPTRRI